MRKQLIKAKRAQKHIKADWIEMMQYTKGYGGIIYFCWTHRFNEEGC